METRHKCYIGIAATRRDVCFFLLALSQGRTDGQCQHRWQKVLNPELVKGPWTKEEDQKVRGAGSFLFWDWKGLMGLVSDREDWYNTSAKCHNLQVQSQHNTTLCSPLSRYNPPSLSLLFFSSSFAKTFHICSIMSPLNKTENSTSLLWSPVLSLLREESLRCFLPLKVNAVAHRWFPIPEVAQEHWLTPPTCWHLNRNTAAAANSDIMPITMLSDSTESTKWETC